MNTDSVRIACWPPVREHDYLRSLYSALARKGVVVAVDGIPFDNQALTANRDRFDILHLHWPEHLWGAGSAAAWARVRGIAGLWSYLRLAHSLGIPIVWTAHNLAPHDGRSAVDTLGYAVLRAYADLVVCHDTAAQNAVAKWLGRERTLVMPHGNFRLVWPAPEDRVRTRQGLGLAAYERLLLGFGLIRPYKGFDLAVRAARLLGPGHRLLIAGPAPDVEYLAELRRLADGQPGVTIRAEHVPTQEFVNLLEAADCALLPYRAITGSGALLGAATAGLGFVASRLPYFVETLALAPDAGVLHEGHDPEALAAAIRTFFSVPHETRCQAAQRLSDLHDWDEVVVPLAEWMRGVVRNRGRRV